MLRHSMKETYKPSNNELIAMLSISKRLLFDQVHRHASEELSKRLDTIDPVKQLLLANEHEIDRWRIDAYWKLVERPDRWTMEATKELPLEDVVNIVNCRELYRDKDNWTMETVRVPNPSGWDTVTRETWTLNRSALDIVRSELKKDEEVPSVSYPSHCASFPIVVASVSPLFTPALDDSDSDSD